MFYSRKNKIITGVTALFLVGAGGFLLTTHLMGKGENENYPLFQFEESVQSAAIVLGEDYQKFTHPDYGFSVEYPQELKIKAFAEDKDSQTIVFQKEEEKFGFQIFVSPFEEGEVLTQERILEDLPSAIIEEPQEVIIGDGIHALLFWSFDPTIGKTREVWFPYQGYLYEITTYAHLDIWLAQILSTWSFNNLF